MAGNGEGGGRGGGGGLPFGDPSVRFRAPYAADPAASRGRQVPEPASPTRTPFQRDRDRIVHATAFRRLKDKTQVFLYDEGDHYRTRLTHSLEVSQVARSLARALGLDEDLTEAIALAHDLGHPPFGHAGERALDAAMRPFGGFDHNEQTWRVVTRLERRYPRFDGLNLSWEVLEGIVKHNGPLLRGGEEPAGPGGLPAAAVAWDLLPSSQPGLEAQMAAIADDIAYDAHDIDDGLRAGLLTLDGLAGVPLLAAIMAEIEAEYPALEMPRRVHELLRRLITRMIEDVIGESTRRLAAARPDSADAVRRQEAPLVAFSTPMADADRAIKAELKRRVYRHRRVMEVMGRAEAAVGRLFARYRDDPAALPAEWRPAPGADEAGRARGICDFIAGMTDRFAIGEYRRLFDETAEFG